MAAPTGERNGRAKLTAARVARIHQLHRTNPDTNWSALARQWGVSARAVYAARDGETWRDARRKKTKRK